jgi:hypothetical protein
VFTAGNCIVLVVMLMMLMLVNFCVAGFGSNKNAYLFVSKTRTVDFVNHNTG